VDDGVLDVRAISAEPALARLRLLSAILTGTTERSRDVRMWESRRLDVRTMVGDLILAVDGEVLPGVQRAVLTIDPGALTVYSPLTPSEAGS
jgi:undecaprenyl-diphosphatase